MPGQVMCCPSPGTKHEGILRTSGASGAIQWTTTLQHNMRYSQPTRMHAEILPMHATAMLVLCATPSTQSRRLEGLHVL